MVTLISAFYIVPRSCIHVQRTPVYLHCSTLSLLVKDKWKNLKFQPCENVFKRIKTSHMNLIKNLMSEMKDCLTSVSRFSRRRTSRCRYDPAWCLSCVSSAGSCSPFSSSHSVSFSLSSSSHWEGRPAVSPWHKQTLSARRTVEGSPCREGESLMMWFSVKFVEREGLALPSSSDVM